MRRTRTNGAETAPGSVTASAHDFTPAAGSQSSTFPRASENEFGPLSSTVPELCLHEMFELQVRRTPDAVAVICKDRRLTYSELNTRANELAMRLIARGVGPESLVGLLLERSAELVASVLGILKAGGAYLPIDPAYPDERIAFHLRDAKPSVVLTSDRLALRLPAADFEAVLIDSPGQAVAAGSERLGPVSPLTSGNLAYVMYTSGSTGSPKGVMVSHRNVVNVLTSILEKVPLKERDVVPSLATFCFDISVAEVFLPLSVGAKVVMIDRETAMDGRRLSRRLDETGATFIQPTPATYRLLLEAGWQPKPGLTMVSTGDRLTADLANQLAGRGPVLWNLYGPTETAIWSTGTRIEKPGDPITIGRPLANTRTYILDDRMRSVPPGADGELFIGGDGVTRGYLGRPDLTAERFVPDRFSGAPGARLYRTGDLARFLADGRIEFLGRLDHQVKLRGYRIELGEIEAVLCRHSGVRSAVVLSREMSRDEPRLSAFVVPATVGAVSVRELRAFLKGKLPEYMVPVEMALLERLPLTTNGKVDRQALLGRSTVVEERVKQSPAGSETQQRMIDIWRELLNVETVGVEDDFFDLGGHSLLAMRLMARVERVFGVTPALRVLFERSTLAEFCEHCDELRPGGVLAAAHADDRIEGRI